MNMSNKKINHFNYHRIRKSISLTTQDQTPDPLESLIQELSKPKLNLIHSEQQGKSKRLSLSIKRQPTSSRNLSLIVAFLKQFAFFNQFVDFNGIDENSLERMANYLDIKRINKSEYLYHEGDKPDYFYILMKGKLVFKKMTKKRTTDKPHAFVEEEAIVAEPGYSFNERNFMLKERRTNSCYTIEDSDVLYMNEEGFKFTLIKPLLKNETEKKSFLLRSFINIQGLNHQLYEGLYMNITPRLVRSNEFLIKENETGKRIFIVFQNELIVSKYIMTKDKCINHPLCKVSKGAVLGLEVLFEKESYLYSLQGSHQQEEVSYVFEFDLSQINDEMKRKLREVHSMFYFKFKEAMEMFYVSKINHEKSNSLSYPNISLDLFSNEELFNHKLEKSYNKIIEEQKTKKGKEVKGKLFPSKVSIYSLPKLPQTKLFVTNKTKGINSNLFSAFNNLSKKIQLTQLNQKNILGSTMTHSKSCKAFRIKTIMTNTNRGRGTLLNKTHSTSNQHQYRHQSLGEKTNDHHRSPFSKIISPHMKDTLFDFAKSTVNSKHKFNSGIFKMPLLSGGLMV